MLKLEIREIPIVQYKIVKKYNYNVIYNNNTAYNIIIVTCEL